MDLRVNPTHKDDSEEMDSRIKSENDSVEVERASSLFLVMPRQSSPRFVMPDPIGHPLEFNSVDLRVNPTPKDDSDGVE